MTYDGSTGDSGDELLTLSSGASFVRNTKVQDARCETYDIPYERSAVVKQTLRTEQGQASQKMRRTALTDERPLRYAVGLHLRRARSCAERMENAASEGDFMELAESGFALTDELAELWKLREIREEEWAAALNFLQAALGQEEFERFRPDQCTAVRAVIDDYLAAGAMDEDDVGRVRMILRRADFDPWKAVSAVAE